MPAASSISPARAASSPPARKTEAATPFNVQIPKMTLPIKTAVVTGGAGFLGSHLTDRLLAEGYRVIGVDNFITGNKANLDHLKNNPNYSFQEQDVSKFIEIAGDVNFIFHF